MFQFPRCPPRSLCIQLRVIRVHLIGFPHSEISGSTFATNYPELFAGDRVLHRHLAPRHPPCALCSLTYKYSSIQPGHRPGDADIAIGDRYVSSSTKLQFSLVFFFTC